MALQYLYCCLEQVKDGTALEFLLELMSTLKSEKGGASVVNIIKKSGLESRINEFFPSNNQQQTEENITDTFMAKDLKEIVTFRKAQAGQNAKKELQLMIKEAIDDEKSMKEIIAEVKDAISKNPGITEQDAVGMVSRIISLLIRTEAQCDETFSWRQWT